MSLNKNCYEPWDKLCSASDLGFEAAFARYVATVLAELQAGRLTSEYAGRHLAKSLFLPLIDGHSVCEAIAQYGGLLEVRRPHSEQTELLAKIRALLDEIEPQV